MTSASRTLIDLAAQSGIRRLEQAFGAAQRAGLTDPDQLSAALARRKNARGSRVLRSWISGHSLPLFTRSLAEERLIALVRSGGLPDPRTNVRVEGIEVDAVWLKERVVVEVDGYAFHAERAPFERDRDRGALLVSRGFRVLRVTWRQLTEKPNVVLVRIGQTLALASARR